MDLIGRDREIGAAVQPLADLIRGAHTPDCVIFYSGGPAIGKTALLRAIHARSRARMAHAWVDFDRSVVQGRYDPPLGPIRLAQDILHALSVSGDLALGDAAVEGLGADAVDEAADRVVTFAVDLARSQRQHPQLFLIDSLEDADSETLIWLEEKILAPIVNTVHALVVFGSRTPPNQFDRDLIYALERRTVRVALSPFDEGETARQFNLLNAIVDIGSDSLHRLTNGLPGLNELAVRLVGEGVGWSNELRRRLVEDRLLARFPPQTQCHLTLLAPLRQFDSQLLGAIFSSLGYALSDEEPRQTRARLRALLQTRLIDHHPSGYGYVIVEAIRPVLDAYLYQTRPDHHAAVLRIAAAHGQNQEETG